MIQTTLITGGTKEERMAYIQSQCNTWQVQSFDQTILSPKTEATERIGIADVRAWQKTLLFTPHHGSYTVGIIPDAHLLTIEAQNALLKTLEEPLRHVIIFCETDQPDSLLATVRSRLMTHVIPTTKHTIPSEDVTTWLTMSATLNHGGIIRFVDATWKEKTEAQRGLTALLWHFHTLLITHTNTDTTPPSDGWSIDACIKCIRSIQTGQNKLLANVNHRLVLDHVWFTILSLQPKD